MNHDLSPAKAFVRALGLCFWFQIQLSNFPGLERLFGLEDIIIKDEWEGQGYRGKLGRGDNGPPGPEAPAPLYAVGPAYWVLVPQLPKFQVTPSPR